MKRTPKHVSSTYMPNGQDEHSTSYPMAALIEHDYWCKYCHTEHDNWWLMSPDDYGKQGMILCGECEHTSLDDDLEELFGMDAEQLCERWADKNNIKKYKVNK